VASSRSAFIASAARLILSAVLGIGVAVVGAFTHTWTIVVGGTALVIGLPLALALLAVTVFVIAPRIHVASAWALASGWIVTVMVLSWPRAAGDVVIPGTWDGYTFLAAGLVIGLVGAARAAGSALIGVRPASGAVAADR
jgi:hypothetical protein